MGRRVKPLLERNPALVDALPAVADANWRHVAQIAIAWVLSRGDIVPLIEARSARGGSRGGGSGAHAGGRGADWVRAARRHGVAGERFRGSVRLADPDSERKEVGR